MVTGTSYNRHPLTLAKTPRPTSSHTFLSVFATCRSLTPILVPLSLPHYLKTSKNISQFVVLYQCSQTLYFLLKLSYPILPHTFSLKIVECAYEKLSKPQGFWLTASARRYIARVGGGVVFARVRVLTAKQRRERRRRGKHLKVSPPHSPPGFATLPPKLAWCERSRCRGCSLPRTQRGRGALRDETKTAARETSISGVSAIAGCPQAKSF